MNVTKKNFDWIDSIRVLSTLNIIIFHYVVVMMNNPLLQDGIHKYFIGMAHWGVAAFFGISGYLIVNSLEHSTNISEFYRRKIVRVVIPFIMIYILALGILVLAKIFICIFVTHRFVFDYTPSQIFFGMIPFDLNILHFFGIKYLFLAGEWFVGTLIWMYLISPLIYKFLRKNIPVTLIITVIIASLTANFFQDFETQGKIFSVQTIFLVRLPEFVTGMVLFMCRDKIFQNSQRLLVIILTAAMVAYTALSNIDIPSIWSKYYFGTVINLHFILAAMLSVYFSFVVADLLNKNFKNFMLKINSYKDISYMAILIQHLTIYLFDQKILNFNTIGIFGAVITFVIIMVMIIFMSRILKKYYTPFEKKLLG